MFEEAGLTVTRENKKTVDEALHKLVSVRYKDCPSAWREIKRRMSSKDSRAAFIQDLQKALRNA